MQRAAPKVPPDLYQGPLVFLLAIELFQDIAQRVLIELHPEPDIGTLLGELGGGEVLVPKARDIIA